jgi:hypothetical protein
VALPARADDWRPPRGFAEVSREVRGTGQPLEIALQPADADRVLIVQAVKDHAAGGNATIRSAVTLAGAAVQLVRPNPAPELTLALDIDSGGLTVLGGEPGVFYHVRAQADPGGEFRRPAYVHKRDPDDPSLNKGIDALAIGVDFAVARPAGPTDPAPGGDRASDPPAPPTVETRGLEPGSVLHLRAVKAQTGVEAELAGSATIPATAAAAPEAPEVATGGATRILVSASDAEDRYQLMLDGAPSGSAKNGTGADLGFATPPINARTIFVIRASRRSADGLKLVRDRRVAVAVAGG